MTLGNAQAVLDIVIEHTRTRTYGREPVRNHSLQAAMIADMAIGIESATRLLPIRGGHVQQSEEIWKS